VGSFIANCSSHLKSYDINSKDSIDHFKIRSFGLNLENSISCGLALRTKSHGFCLEPTKNQASKNTRFTNPIFNDIVLGIVSSHLAASKKCMHQ
jgi:hypothetical protein